MKVFLLAITILLLINRIRSTPRMLSKTLYENSAQQGIDEVIKKINNVKTVEEKETVMAITQIIVKALAWLYSTIVVIYYMLIGSAFQSNSMIVMLTAIQIVTMFIGTRMSLKEFDFVNPENMRNETHFHRHWFLFNVVLDYAYYPMIIYLLLNCTPMS